MSRLGMTPSAPAHTLLLRLPPPLTEVERKQARARSTVEDPPRVKTEAPVSQWKRLLAMVLAWRPSRRTPSTFALVFILSWLGLASGFMYEAYFTQIATLQQEALIADLRAVPRGTRFHPYPVATYHYTVRYGDTLSAILKECEVTHNAQCAREWFDNYNPEVVPTKLKPRMTIQIAYRPWGGCYEGTNVCINH